MLCGPGSMGGLLLISSSMRELKLPQHLLFTLLLLTSVAGLGLSTLVSSKNVNNKEVPLQRPYTVPSKPLEDKSISRTVAKIESYGESGRVILLTCGGKCARERTEVGHTHNKQNTHSNHKHTAPWGSFIQVQPSSSQVQRHQRHRSRTTIIRQQAKRMRLHVIPPSPPSSNTPHLALVGRPLLGLLFSFSTGDTGLIGRTHSSSRLLLSCWLISWIFPLLRFGASAID